MAQKKEFVPKLLVFLIMLQFTSIQGVSFSPKIYLAASSAFFAAQIIIRLSFFKAFSQLCEGPGQ
jgi:hypothetical protein